MLDGPRAAKRKERTNVMKGLSVLLDGPWAVKGTGQERRENGMGWSEEGDRTRK